MVVRVRKYFGFRTGATTRRVRRPAKLRETTQRKKRRDSQERPMGWPDWGVGKRNLLVL